MNRPKSAKNAQKNSQKSKGRKSNQKQSSSLSSQNPTRKAGLKSSQVGVSAAYASGQSGRAPTVVMSRDSCRVVHRELLSNVSGTSGSGFVLAQGFALNPGLSATFPWLANMAQNWETYRFNRLRICYYTRTGSNTSGSVLIAPDYDSSDAPPSSEQIMSSYEDVQEDAPWKDITCILRPSALHNLGPRKFIRTGGLGPGQDIKTYDAGNVFIATVDSASAASWGKLWIDYDVTFTTPQLPPSGVVSSSVVAIEGGGGQSDAQPFGNTPTVSTGGVGLSINLNDLIFSGLVPGQEYLLVCFFDGTVISAASSAIGAGFTSVAAAGIIDSTGTHATIRASLIATSDHGNVILGLTATTVTSAELAFTAIPSGVI